MEATPTLAVTSIAPGAVEPCDTTRASIRARIRSASSSAPSSAGLRQGDHELLAAVARRLVDPARLELEDAADRAQHLVALQVAVGVVDLLEVVDVEHDQRQLVAEALGARRLLLDQLAEAARGWRAR